MQSTWYNVLASCIKEAFVAPCHFFTKQKLVFECVHMCAPLSHKPMLQFSEAKWPHILSAPRLGVSATFQPKMLQWSAVHNEHLFHRQWAGQMSFDRLANVLMVPPPCSSRGFQRIKLHPLAPTYGRSTVHNDGSQRASKI